MPERPEPPATSVTLLMRLRANEPAAWQTMVRLYTPLLYHWCGRAGLQGADADDVVQEVFRSASTHLGDFRRDRPEDSFRGWLRAITWNAIRLHFRKSGRQVKPEGGTDALKQMQEVADPSAEEPADDLATAEGECDELRRRALELVRSEFEERTWQMFWLTVVDDRPASMVAAEMEVSPAAVRMARSRVLRRLKDEFADLIS